MADRDWMHDEPTRSRPRFDTTKVFTSAFGLIGLCIVVMWATEIVDTVALSSRLQGGGIHPRRLDGLDGILWAPFLHGGFLHLVSNTIPFVVLGGLVAVRGLDRWLIVTGTCAAAGGALTWLLAGGGNHIGASGVVFGYLGALFGAAIFERRPAAIAPAMVALMLYGTMLLGFVPQVGISWEGHLFGFVAGLLTSKSLAERRRPTPDYDVQ